jgi:hypothetical protein
MGARNAHTALSRRIPAIPAFGATRGASFLQIPQFNTIAVFAGGESDNVAA